MVDSLASFEILKQLLVLSTMNPVISTKRQLSQELRNWEQQEIYKNPDCSNNMAPSHLEGTNHSCYIGTPSFIFGDNWFSCQAARYQLSQTQRREDTNLPRDQCLIVCSSDRWICLWQWTRRWQRTIRWQRFSSYCVRDTWRFCKLEWHNTMVSLNKGEGSLCWELRSAMGSWLREYWCNSPWHLRHGLSFGDKSFIRGWNLMKIEKLTWGFEIFWWQG